MGGGITAASALPVVVDIRCYLKVDLENSNRGAQYKAASLRTSQSWKFRLQGRSYRVVQAIDFVQQHSIGALKDTRNRMGDEIRIRVQPWKQPWVNSIQIDSHVQRRGTPNEGQVCNNRRTHTTLCGYKQNISNKDAVLGAPTCTAEWWTESPTGPTAP